MKEIIEPLALVPGVRLVAMVSPDGIPIAIASNSTAGSDELGGQERADQPGTLSVVAAGWLADVTRVIAALSWGSPQRLMMRGPQGTVVLHQGPGALLVTVLERGTSPEEIHVPMEGAIARMARVLRGMGTASQNPGSREDGGPPGILPAPQTTIGLHREPQENASKAIRGNE
ncbi:MAG: roadblock/LC7 domain-containing protein [bacterium]|nr:roadblock/LC7 domain-containing protein [bacterium]